MQVRVCFCDSACECVCVCVLCIIYLLCVSGEERQHRRNVKHNLHTSMLCINTLLSRAVAYTTLKWALESKRGFLGFPQLTTGDIMDGEVFELCAHTFTRVYAYMCERPPLSVSCNTLPLTPTHARTSVCKNLHINTIELTSDIKSGGVFGPAFKLYARAHKIDKFCEVRTHLNWEEREEKEKRKKMKVK